MCIRDSGYIFDRKEEKKHGDGGSFVGKVPTNEDIIVFVDDVITSASTKITGMEKVLRAFDAKFEAIIVGVDRRSPSGLAVKNVPVYSLTTLQDARKFHSSFKIHKLVFILPEIDESSSLLTLNFETSTIFSGSEMKQLF